MADLKTETDSATPPAGEVDVLGMIGAAMADVGSAATSVLVAKASEAAVVDGAASDN